VFANIPFQKQILTPEELSTKMEEVETRWARDLASSARAAKSKGHTTGSELQ
jgi:hypothetical protein